MRKVSEWDRLGVFPWVLACGFAFVAGLAASRGDLEGAFHVSVLGFLVVCQRAFFVKGADWYREEIVLFLQASADSQERVLSEVNEKHPRPLDPEMLKAIAWTRASAIKMAAEAIEQSEPPHA